MGKIPTDVENVFRIEMSNGKGRLWCGACKKFLSEASGGVHTCDTNWRARLSSGRKAAGSGRKRKYRMTPKRVKRMTAIITNAVKYGAIKGNIGKLIKGKPKHPIVKRLSSDAIDKHVKSTLKYFGL